MSEAAFVVVPAQTAKGVLEPIVAAARVGKGRVVAFGHPGYLDSGGDDLGAPVVFVPGFTCVADDYTEIMPVLGRRTVVVELRGHGCSTAPAGPFDSDALARDALSQAGPGSGPATVLLSPAAASFDMFVDYAARGAAFKRAVAAVAASHRARGRDA